MGAAFVNKPTKSIDARITGGLDTDSELYKVINKRPGYSIYSRRRSGDALFGSVIKERTFAFN